MMEPTVGAVLMVGHFIISIFGVQLGQPVIYSMPFQTMEQCAVYKAYLPAEAVLDLEWKHHTKTQCFTLVEFQAMMAKQTQRQAKPTGTPEP
jgi:hypothetical protein